MMGCSYHISITKKEDIAHLTTTKKEGIAVKKRRLKRGT